MTSSLTPEAASASNPLFSDSGLALGYLRFDTITDAHLGEALEKGMQQQLAEIEAIAQQEAAPTFANTLVALERSGEVFTRAEQVFFNLVLADSNPERERLQTEFSPRLATHSDEILLNRALFERIDALYQQRDQLDLDPESLRLLEYHHRQHVRAGVLLDDAQQRRLRELNEELARLSTRFEQRVLAEVNASAVGVASKDALAGLSDAQIEAAAEAARARGLSDDYAITLLNTTDQPLLVQLENRALREAIHRASSIRGARGNEWDTTAIVAEATRLRAERANLLGHAHHAGYELAERTAKTADAVNALLARLAGPAADNARREAARLQQVVDDEQAAKGEPSFSLAAWDWGYYAEKLRVAEYAFDEGALRPYLELDSALENGAFFAASELYGLRFEQRSDLPLPYPDSRVYNVFDQDGSQLAIFVFDPYARDSKRGGAWMTVFAQQSRLLKQKAIVSNHLNIAKPRQGEPTLLSWDEVITLFHEFGHALHGMLSDVEYPSFSGTNVPTDFVEFPSQFNEMWAKWPSVLANYARHYQSGEPMPSALREKMLAAEGFNQGFALTEYLAAAIIDQYWHQMAPEQCPAPDQLTTLEQVALEQAGIALDAVPPRYHTPYFSHIMAGYGAGYYSYIWAEVLDADSEEWFKAHGGLCRENGDRLRQCVLSRGGSVDAGQLFETFYGGEPEVAPLLRKRGLSE